MKAIPTEADQNIIPFVDAQFFAGRVIRTLPNGEEPNQQTLVGKGVEVVELGLDVLKTLVGMTGVQVVSSEPG